MNILFYNYNTNVILMIAFKNMIDHVLLNINMVEPTVVEL